MVDPSTEDAVDQATRLDEIGFPEFTSKLISDTFTAIVSSMINQQEAYADLVEKVAMSIEEFENEAVRREDVDRWLAENYPGSGDNDTAIREGNTISESQVNSLHTDLGPTAEQMDSVTLPPEGSETKLSETQVGSIRRAVTRSLAEPRMDALEQLVEQGVVRLVVDDGTIETDVKFHTYGSEYSESSSSTYERDSWGIGGNASFVGAMFGIGARGSYSSVSVSTTHKEDRAYSSSDVKISGNVEINVKGDYQPLQVPEGEGEGDQSGNGQ